MAPMKAAELKRIRKALGMTQQQLADALGVTRATVGRWEASMRQMSEMATRLIRRLAAERKAT